MASEGFREKRKLAQKAEIIVKFETKERYNNIRQILKKEPSLRNEEELHLIASSRDIVQEIEKRVQRQQLVKRRVEEVLQYCFNLYCWLFVRVSVDFHFFYIGSRST